MTHSEDDIQNIDTASNSTDNNSEDELELDSDDAKLNMLKNLKYDFESYEIKYIYETYLKNQEVNLSPSYQREIGRAHV